MKKIRRGIGILGVSAALAAILVLASCTTVKSGVGDDAARPTTYEAVDTPGSVSSIGIESQDIVSLTSEMVRDLLNTPEIADRVDPPRIVLDPQYVENLSSNRIDKGILTDRMRVEANRSARGRILFIEREDSAMIESERDLKRRGKVDAGTVGGVEDPAGADFRLKGRIRSLDAADANTSAQSRYTYISMEMVDLETGVIIWSNDYEFKKAGRPGVANR